VLFLRKPGGGGGGAADLEAGVSAQPWPAAPITSKLSASAAASLPSLDDAVAELARRPGPLRVVFATGTFVRPYASVTLRLGGGDDRASRPAIKGESLDPRDVTVSVSDLDRAFARLPAGVDPPLVVLEADGPVSPTEAGRQLLLRNLFANELFALGSVQAVVALGMETGARDGRARFLRALARGDSVVEAIDAVRLGWWASSQKGGLKPGVPEEAVALWSNLPGYALPRTGKVEP
jgi:hypothetical protein